MRKITKILAIILLIAITGTIPVHAGDDEAEGSGIIYDDISISCGMATVSARGYMPEAAYLSVRSLDKDILESYITGRMCSDEEEFVVYEAYDIKIMTDDGEYQPVDGDITVTIENVPLPDETKDEHAPTVIHIDEDDNVEELSTYAWDIYDGVSVEFETPGFSTFVIGEYRYSTEADDYNAEKHWYRNVGDPDPSKVNVCVTRGYYSEDGTTYYHDGFMLIAEGSGDMQDFDTPPWNDMKWFINEACVINSVSSVGNRFLYGFTYLEFADLSQYVISIGEEAFSGCTSLRELYTSYRLENIGRCAFYGCTSLTRFNFYPYIKSIGEDAFSGCENLETLNFYGFTLDEDHTLPYVYYNTDGDTIRTLKAGVTYNGPYTRQKPYPDYVVSLPATIDDVDNPGDITVYLSLCDTDLAERFWVSVAPASATVTMTGTDNDGTGTLDIEIDNGLGGNRVYGIRNMQSRHYLSQNLTFNADRAGIYTGTITYDITSGLD